MENVLPFKDKIERLIDDVQFIQMRRLQLETKLDEMRQQWRDETLTLCVRLAELRAEFKSDNEFGERFDASGIKLNKNDRAAAIKMGQHPDRARDVIWATESRSLQLIELEGGFPSARKPAADTATKPEPKTKPKASKPKAETKAKKPKAAPQYDRAKEEVLRSGAEGEALSRAKMAEAAGVSEESVRRARSFSEGLAAGIAQARAEFKAAAEQATVEAIEQSLPQSDKQRVEKVIAAHKAKLNKLWDSALNAKVSEGIRNWDQRFNAELVTRFEKLEKLVNTDKGFMSAKDYNTIMKCLHPDNIKGMTEERLNEAFRLFTDYRLVLVKEERKKELSDISGSTHKMSAADWLRKAKGGGQGRRPTA